MSFVLINLIVAIVSDFDLVEAVPGKDRLPLLAWDEGGGVHGAAVADDKAIAIRAFGQIEESIFNLEHCFQQVFLKKNHKHDLTFYSST